MTGEIESSEKDGLAVVRAAKNFDGVREQVRDGLQRIDRAFGTAGQIDDDGFVADDRDTAGKDSRGSFFDALAANFFRKAGNAAIGDVKSCFGSGIARAEAGATGGE